MYVKDIFFLSNCFKSLFSLKIQYLLDKKKVVSTYIA